jgi:hypothetical protein
VDCHATLPWEVMPMQVGKVTTLQSRGLWLSPLTPRLSVIADIPARRADGARGAREKNLTFLRNRSGAAMYPAFECSRCGRWP